MVSAIEAELPGIEAPILARAWIAGARAELKRDAATWEQPTDHDRLDTAFTECRAHGLAVFENVERESDAAERLRVLPSPPRGVVFFEPEAVWRALDTGVLDLRLRSGTGAPAVEGDWLAGAVLGCLERHGLRARWHDGVQVATHWRRRPAH